MKYYSAVKKRDEKDLLFMTYVADSLRTIPQNKFITAKFIDILNPPPVDKRNGDEIAIYIINKYGLKVAK